MIPEADERIKDYIRRVAVGPKGSRDLSRDEARDAMEIMLRGETSDVRSGVLLVALRLKRETMEELTGLLDALRASCLFEVAEVDRVVDLADPYDGFVRAPHFGIFTAALLAGCGVPTVVHGGQEIPPKQGCTHRLVLERLGGAVDGTPGSVAGALEKAGWGYVDLAQFCPALHELTSLRREIVKRPALAFLEKFLAPVRGRKQTLFVAGYVHAGYDELTAQIASVAPYSGCLVIRGAEGHTDFFTQRATQTLDVDLNGQRSERSWEPSGAGVQSMEWPAEFSVDATSVADAGREAMMGQEGPALEQLVWTAGAVLSWIGDAADPLQGVEIAREAIQSGRGQTALEAGLALPGPKGT